MGPANVNVFVGNSTTTPFTAYSTSTPTIKAFSNIAGYQGGTGGLAVGNLSNHPATANDPGGVGDIIVGSGVGTTSRRTGVQLLHQEPASRSPHTITPMFSAIGHRRNQRGRGRRHRRQNPRPGHGCRHQRGVASRRLEWRRHASQNQFTAFTGSGNTAALHVAIAKVNGVNDILVAQNTGGLSHQLKTFTSTGAAVGAAFAQTQSWLQGGINLD